MEVERKTCGECLSSYLSSLPTYHTWYVSNELIEKGQEGYERGKEREKRR